MEHHRGPDNSYQRTLQEHLNAGIAFIAQTCVQVPHQMVKDFRKGASQGTLLERGIMNSPKGAPKSAVAATLFATYICLEIVFVAGSVSGPTWRRIFDLSHIQLGICLGGTQVGVFLVSLIVGHMTYRTGPLRMLFFSLGGALLSLTLVFSSIGFITLMAGLIGFGICAASICNAAATLLSGIFPGRVRFVMSLASALWFGSSVISGPLIGHWLDFSSDAGLSIWGFRLPFALMFVCLGGCLIIGRLLFKKRLEKSPWSSGAEKTSGHGGIRSKWEWLWVPALAFCHGAMLISLMSWLNPMAQETYGVSDLLGSFFVGIMAFGVGAGRLALALFSGKISWDDRTVLFFSAGFAALLLTLAVVAPTYGTTLVFLGLAGFCCSPTAPCLFSIVGERFTAERSQLYGYMEASIAAAAFSGSLLIGLLADGGIPLRAAVGISPASAGIMAAGALIWIKRRPGEAAGESPPHRHHIMSSKKGAAQNGA